MISAALVMAEGIQALRKSKIGKGEKLVLHGGPLTREKLRSTIDCAVL